MTRLSGVAPAGRAPGDVLITILLAALLLPAPAAALFDSGEMGKTDTEQDLDYEYFSDLQAFSYPMEWKLAWDEAGESWSHSSTRSFSSIARSFIDW